MIATARVSRRRQPRIGGRLLQPVALGESPAGPGSTGLVEGPLGPRVPTEGVAGASAVPELLRLLVPAGTTPVEVPWQPWGERRVLEGLRGLERATPVALQAGGPGAQARLHRVCRQADLVLEHEYLLLPGRDDCRAVVENDPLTIALLLDTLPWLHEAKARSPLAWWAFTAGSRQASRLLGSTLPRLVTGRRS